MSATRYALDALVAAAAAILKERGVPLIVRFGAVAYTTGIVCDNEAIIEHLDGGDKFGPSPRQRGNPRPLVERTVGATAEIRGRSSANGASILTHRAHVTALLHQLIASLMVAGLRSGREPRFTKGGFITDQEQTQEYGARYGLLFEVSEIVTDEAWQTVDTPTTDRTDKMIHPDGSVSTLEN